MQYSSESLIRIFNDITDPGTTFPVITEIYAA